jgi:branched-chain amino acid transport system ATP-binding protein
VSSADSVLRVEGIVKRFGGVHALRGVDLEIRAGERRAVLGPNGAGKTTLFGVISGSEFPTAGTIELLGQSVTNLPEANRARLGLARTFQTSRVFSGLTVLENLYLGALGVSLGHHSPIKTRNDGRLRDGAERTAGRVGLGDRLRVAAADLSHGEQRQLELGLALVADPRLLMLDEPAAGLSRAERQLLTQLLLSLGREVTLILIEHDMDVALTVAEHVTIMHEGRVVMEGSPAETRASKLVRDLYLGGVRAA